MNNLWRRLLPSLGLAALVASPIPALGVEETSPRHFNLTGFRTVEVQAGIQVELVAGAYLVQPLTDRLPRDLDVRVEGDRLILGYKPLAWGTHRGPVRFRVVLPVLRALDLSGGAGAQVGPGLADPSQLLVTLSGGSQIHGAVTTGRLRLELSGGSQAFLQGAVGELTLDASGGSGLPSPGLRAQDSHLVLSGGASADLILEARAVIDASGGSHLRYFGHPRLEQSLSGGASVDGGF